MVFNCKLENVGHLPLGRALVSHFPLRKRVGELQQSPNPWCKDYVQKVKSSNVEKLIGIVDGHKKLINRVF